MCCWCLRATLLKAHSTQAKSFLNGPRSFRLPFLACTFAFSHRYRIGVYFVHFIMKISRQMTSNNTDTGAFYIILFIRPCSIYSSARHVWVFRVSISYMPCCLWLCIELPFLYYIHRLCGWLTCNLYQQPSDLCWWHNRCVYKMKFHTYKIILLMWNVNIKYWCLQAVFKRIS